MQCGIRVLREENPPCDSLNIPLITWHVLPVQAFCENFPEIGAPPHFKTTDGEGVYRPSCGVGCGIQVALASRQCTSKRDPGGTGVWPVHGQDARGSVVAENAGKAAINRRTPKKVETILRLPLYYTGPTDSATLRRPARALSTFNSGVTVRVA